MEPITISQASKLSGKTRKTIRKWLSDGKIQKSKPPKNGRKDWVYINKDTLMSYLATYQGNVKDTTHITTQPDVYRDKYIEKLERENDSKKNEINQLKQELKEARQQISDLKEKAWSLELKLSQTNTNKKSVVKGLFGHVQKLLTA